MLFQAGTHVQDGNNVFFVYTMSMKLQTPFWRDLCFVYLLMFSLKNVHIHRSQPK